MKDKKFKIPKYVIEECLRESLESVKTKKKKSR